MSDISGINTTLSFDKSLLFTPEGVRDVYGKDCLRRDNIVRKIKDTMRVYGFSDIQTPTFEFFDIFAKERGTISSREMFKFFDQHNNTLVLRPDITPSVARCVSRYYADEDMELRLCYTGNTFIHQMGYQGKLSESMQIGAELINDSSSDADGEMIALTIECLKKCGLPQFQVDIGHAGVLRGLIREAGLDSVEKEQLKNAMANKNSYAVDNLLKDKDIKEPVRELLVKLPGLFGGIEAIDFALKRTTDEKAREALERLSKLYEIMSEHGMGDHITFDLGMISHYDYYTGVIFKAYTYGTGDAIVTGGRYDDLVAQFGKDAPAIGLVFILDQLMEALDGQRVEIDIPKKDALILYRSANRKKAMELTDKLRREGKSVVIMRKDAKTALDKYKEYAKRREFISIYYIDDTGEITIIDI